MSSFNALAEYIKAYLSQPDFKPTTEEIGKVFELLSILDGGATKKPARTERTPKQKKSGVPPAKQRQVKEAMLELGDGATDQQIVEDIRGRQQSNHLSKDDETARVQVRTRASGMKYVRKHRSGGWELVGSIRSLIRKPHIAASA